MLCQLSYRGRQPADCTEQLLGDSGWGRRARAGRELLVMRRFAVVGVALSIGVCGSYRGWHRGQRTDRCGPGRAQGARVRPGAGRRRPRAADAERARVVPAGEEAPRRRQARPQDAAGARSSRPPAARAARARCRRGRLGRRGARVPAAAARASAAGRRRPFHAARPHPHCGGITGPRAHSRRDRGPEHLPRARENAPPPARTSCGPGRASSRSPRATTSAPGCWRDGTGCR